MKERIRNWLGLDDDRKFLSDQIAADFFDLRNRINNLELENRRYHIVTQQALGRIVGKVDPIFAKSEFDPDRKAESDRLGEEVIKRLQAEDWARKHTEGFPDAPPK